MRRGTATGPARLERVEPSRTQRLLTAALVAMAVAALHLVAAEHSVLRRLELATLDARFALRGARSPTGAVVILAIDEATLASGVPWPLPRRLLAESVRALDAMGAAVVAIDLLLLERPAAATGDGSQEDIGALETALQRSGEVVLAFALSPEPLRAADGRLEQALASAAIPRVIEKEGVARDDLPFRSVLAPPPALTSAAALLGHTNVLIASDGVLRFSLPSIAHEGQALASLPVQAARAYEGVPRERVTLEVGRRLLLGDMEVPLDRSGRHWIDYLGPNGTIPTIPLGDLLEGRVAAERIDGRIVLLGATAGGTGERFTTPTSASMPAVETLATVVDNTLSGRSLERRAPQLALEFAAILVLAGLSAAGVARGPSRTTALWPLLLCAGWFALAHLLFVRTGAWVYVTTPIVAVLLPAIILGIVRFGAEREARRRSARQRDNLRRYFSPALVDRIADIEREGALDGALDAVVMFVDIVGFSGLCESLRPEEAMALLRGFQRRVEDVVFEHNGMVDKYIGDGTLACFGVPLPQPRASADAVRAALELMDAIEAWNEERRGGGEPPLRVAIGLHGGRVMAGDIGGRHIQYTVVGDPVNVASRLEALCRQLDAGLVVSRGVADAAAREDPELARLLTDFRSHPPQRLRGRQQPIEVLSLQHKETGVQPA